MKFFQGGIRLSDITNGALALGRVPWQRIARERVGATNAGVVTVTAALTSVVTLALTDLLLNDLVVVFSRIRLTKGATAGDIALFVERSAGVASVEYYTNRVLLEEKINTLAIAAVGVLTLNGLGHVTLAGTYTLKLNAQSFGSNSTVAVGDGSLEALVLHGS